MNPRNIFKRIDYVPSGDGERRVRIVWGFRHYHAFVSTHQLRTLVRDILLTLQEEKTYFENLAADTRGEATSNQTNLPPPDNHANTQPNNQGGK